jgi:hypothetical protein
VVWAKPKAVPGSFYLSEYELISMFQNGDASRRGHPGGLGFPLQ